MYEYVAQESVCIINKTLEVSVTLLVTVLFTEATDRQTAVGVTSSNGKSTCSQLNTQQLNRGGHHLNQQGLKEPQTGRTLYPF